MNTLREARGFGFEEFALVAAVLQGSGACLVSRLNDPRVKDTSRAGSGDGDDEDPGASVEDGIRLVPYDEAYEAGFEDMHRRVPDLSRIHAAIGWAPAIPFEDTLRDVIAYHRERL